MEIRFIKKECRQTVLIGSPEPFVINKHLIVIAKIYINGKTAMAMVNSYEPDDMRMYKFTSKTFRKPTAFYKEINRLIVNEGFRITAFAKSFDESVVANEGCTNL